jgi:quercetin dioxygenase-like cupin family protein
MSVSVQSEIGSRLRAIRRERRHSLAEVAKATNISKSFLALVESGKSDITITRLMRVTQFYGIHIADVLPSPPAEDEILVRRDEGQHVYSPGERLEVLLLTKHADRAMSPVHVTIEPSGQSEASVHDGEEFVYVLEGQLVLVLGNGEEALLEEGDSAHFASGQLHTYMNPGSSSVRFLSVVTPALF